MSRTVTAMFDSRSDAEAAQSRLQSAGIGANDVQIMDQSSQGLNAGGSSSAGSSSGSSGHGFWSGVKDFFMADEDRYTYEEGVRRGGAVLVARVDEGNVDEAVRILEESSTVDIDEREQSWRQSGYQGYDADTMGGYYGRSNQQATSTGNEEHIPIVEEELRVGKREVSRGGARVRSYVVETPVTEQVTLREEHVNIERRPVSGEYTGMDQAGDRSALFQEREIEVTETSEEAVVAKEARVKEELVVSKTAEEHTETVSDTVRRTEVDVDRLGTDDTDRTSGTSGTTGFGTDTDRTSGTTGTTGLGTDTDRNRSGY